MFVDISKNVCRNIEVIFIVSLLNLNFNSINIWGKGEEKDKIVVKETNFFVVAESSLHPQVIYQENFWQKDVLKSGLQGWFKWFGILATLRKWLGLNS